MPLAIGRGYYATPGKAAGPGLDGRFGRYRQLACRPGPHHMSVKTAGNYGVDISKVCRQFKVSDFDDFDLLLVMDKSNLTNVLSLARNPHDKAKVKLLLHNKEVPDPYFDHTQFEPVYRMIEDGCKAIIAAELRLN
jgi:protein-tyrosine-phosphatase